MIEYICRKLYENKRYGFLPDFQCEVLDLDELGREFATGVQKDSWAAGQYLREIAMWLEKELGY